MVPNLPLFGAMAKMKNEASFAKSIFKTLVDSYDFAKDKEPFLKMTVKREFEFQFAFYSYYHVVAGHLIPFKFRSL